MSLDLALVRERLSYQGISLGVVALLTSAALVVANGLTRAPIAAAEARDLQASLSQVLPAGFADNDLLEDTVDIDQVTIYRARRSGAVAGAVFRMANRGYAGDVVVLMGVDAQGVLTGARVLKHQETPGLGDKIEAAKGDWIKGFAGKSLAEPAPDQWGVRKDGGVFDQFAGATITPRAVVKSVKQGLEFFAAHRAEILGAGS